MNMLVWHNKKIKGFSMLIPLAIIAASVLVFILSLIVIAKFYKLHIRFTAYLYYETNDKDMALLSLLNYRCGRKTIYEIVSNYRVFQITENEKTCIENALKNITNTNCFSLYVEDDKSCKPIIDSMGSCDLGAPICYKISEPYNSNDLSELICLQVG